MIHSDENVGLVVISLEGHDKDNGGGGDGDGDGDGGSQRRLTEAALPCCDGGARPGEHLGEQGAFDPRPRILLIVCGVAVALLCIADFYSRACGRTRRTRGRRQRRQGC